MFQKKKKILVNQKRVCGWNRDRERDRKNVSFKPSAPFQKPFSRIINRTHIQNSKSKNVQSMTFNNGFELSCSFNERFSIHMGLKQQQQHGQQ